MKKLFILGLGLLMHGLIFGQKPKVLIFLDSQCPCAYNHQETFGELIGKYKDSIEFVAISVNKRDQAWDMNEMLKSLGWDIKFVIDKDKSYQKKYKPEVTTECLLLSPKGEVLYRGAVDDSPLNLGQVKNFFLKDAIQDYMAKRPIRVKTSKPVGCLINT
jgi:hypothetical protein